MNKFFYFAYGSNMLGERLQARCPSAVFVGPAYVCGYELQFSKRSIDCSGKATIVESKDSFQKLYGAIFQIDESEIGKLNKAEGSGYERRDDFVVVKSDDGQKEEIEAKTYFAKPGAIGQHLKPYGWYKQLVLWGAIQAELPGSYLARLAAFEAELDLEAERYPDIKRQDEALDLLKGIANCVFSKGTWSIKIADQYTVSDWKAMKSILVPGKPDNWEAAFNLFFRKRIETRYFEPIRLLQEHGENKGEGFSIVALQCSLIEFLASTRSGKNYKFGATKDKRQNGYKYSSGRLVFAEFLREASPFAGGFSDLAGRFYEHVRNALVHEARTKGNWIIRADSPKNINEIVDLVTEPGKTILYRNSLQEAFKTYINGYGKELTTCKDLQEAFIRKFDSLCEE